MKATGIVRRVDSLGRVVIPKEIRHTLRIQEGVPLEIYTDRDGSVTFRKYSPLGDLKEFAAQICAAIRENTGCICAIADRDTVLAVAGASRRELEEHPGSRALDRLMEERKFCTFAPGDPAVPLTDLSGRYVLSLMAPVISQGDLLGCVMTLQEEPLQPPKEEHALVLRTVADFLGRQTE